MSTAHDRSTAIEHARFIAQSRLALALGIVGGASTRAPRRWSPVASSLTVVIASLGWRVRGVLLRVGDEQAVRLCHAALDAVEQLVALREVEPEFASRAPAVRKALEAARSAIARVASKPSAPPPTALPHARARVA
jgi:hypothetical protein